MEEILSFALLNGCRFEVIIVDSVPDKRGEKKNGCLPKKSSLIIEMLKVNFWPID